MAPAFLESPGSSSSGSVALAQEVVPTDPAPPQEDPEGGGQSPDDAAPSEEPEGGGGAEPEGGGEDKACDASGTTDSFAGKLLSPGEDFDTSFTICPLENYYLQYVDFTTIEIDPSKALGYSPKHALNNLASLVFEFNAKFVYYAIAVLNHVLEFDLVDGLKEPTEAVISALGEGFFKIWLPGVYALAVIYGAIQALVRGQVTDGFLAVGKACLIGALGIWLMQPGNATKAIELHNNVTGVLTNTAFCAVGSVNPEAKASGDLGSGARCTVDGSGINAQIWTRYVYEPWQYLQISASNPEKAKEHAEAILAEDDPEAREEKLLEAAGAPTGVVGGVANDLYKGATGRPGADEDIKDTANFIHAGNHLSDAVIMFAMSMLFVVLLGFVSVLLLVSELMVLILILTSMVWLLPAVYPGSSIASKVFNWLVDETVQIFAYKLLIGIYLLIVGLVFAAGWGLGTVLLINGALAVATFRYRAKIKELARPGGGLMRGVRAGRGGLYGGDGLGRAHRQGAHHPPGGGDHGAGGGAAGAAAGASGAPQATRPQSALRRSVREAAVGGFMPEAVAGAAASYARHAPVDAYRNTRRRVGAAVDRLQEEGHAPAQAAARLDRLADKRKGDPRSLTDAERVELENAEAMLARGTDPTSRTSLAARRNQKAAREEFRQRRGVGLSPKQQLVGPRLNGESEAEYLARQKAAEEEAQKTRGKIRNLRDDPEGRGLYPSGEAKRDPRETMGTPEPNEGAEERPCASCGKPFVPEREGVAVCSGCRTADVSQGRPSGGRGDNARFSGGRNGVEDKEPQDSPRQRTTPYDGLHDAPRADEAGVSSGATTTRRFGERATSSGERRGPLWEPGSEKDGTQAGRRPEGGRTGTAPDGETAEAAAQSSQQPARVAPGTDAQGGRGGPTPTPGERLPGDGRDGQSTRPGGIGRVVPEDETDEEAVRRAGDNRGAAVPNEPTGEGSQSTAESPPAGSAVEAEAAAVGPDANPSPVGPVRENPPERQDLRPESRAVSGDAADEEADESGFFGEERVRERERAAAEVIREREGTAQGAHPEGGGGTGRGVDSEVGTAAVIGTVNGAGEAHANEKPGRTAGARTPDPRDENLAPGRERQQARRQERRDAGTPPGEGPPEAQPSPGGAPASAPTAAAPNAQDNASTTARLGRSPAEEEAAPGPKKRTPPRRGRDDGEPSGEAPLHEEASSRPGRRATRPRRMPDEARGSRSSSSGRLPLREAKPARGGEPPKEGGGPTGGGANEGGNTNEGGGEAVSDKDH